MRVVGGIEFHHEAHKTTQIIEIPLHEASCYVSSSYCVQCNQMFKSKCPVKMTGSRTPLDFFFQKKIQANFEIKSRDFYLQ